MESIKLDIALPAIFGHMCLFAFLQKVLYGYGVEAYETHLFVGTVAYDYYTLLLVMLLVVVAIYTAFFSIKSMHKPSRGAIAGAGVAALPAEWFIVFGRADLSAGSMGTAALVFCSFILCVTFCIVWFAWFARIKEWTHAVGATTVLLYALAGSFVYCMATPSNSNNSFYIVIVELIALPLTALCCLFPARPPTCNHDGGQGSGIGQRRRFSTGMLALSGALFFTILTITYMDMLNEGFPVHHIEQPTFYALLLFVIALIIAVIYRGRNKASVVNAATIGLAHILGVFFCLVYLIVSFYSGASYDFCFDFTCTVRRLVVIVFYATTLTLALMHKSRIAVNMGFAFLVPFLLSRIIMRTLYLQTQSGLFQSTVDIRLGMLLALGVMLIILLSTVWWLGRCPSPSRKTIEGRSMAPEDIRMAAITLLGERHALSDREREILCYLSMGHSIDRIAELLAITGNTVGTHVRSIYKKMGLHNKQEAIDIVNGEIENRRT